MSKDPELAFGSAAASAAASWAGQARRTDPDRFLAVLAAPAARRDALCTLILLNHELVRAVEQPSARSGAGPIAALIRLQWWREVVTDSRADWRGQPVAVAVRRLLDDGVVRSETMLGLIDARETEAEGLQTIEDWRAAMLAGPGGIQRALGEALGVVPEQSERLAAVGAAYASGALRRHLPVLLAAERDVLPEAVRDGRNLAELRALLAKEGEAFLAAAAGFALPRGQGSALLPLVLARRDLRCPDALLDRTGGARGLGDRLAVLRAGLFC